MLEAMEKRCRKVSVLSVAWPVAAVGAMSLNCVLVQEVFLGLVREVSAFLVAVDRNVWDVVEEVAALGFVLLSLVYWVSFGTAPKAVRWTVLLLSALLPLGQLLLLFLSLLTFLLSGEVKWLTHFVDKRAKAPFFLWVFTANTVLILLRVLLERLGFGDERKWWEKAKCWWLLWSLPLALWSFWVQYRVPLTPEVLSLLHNRMEWVEVLRVFSPAVLWILGLSGAAALAGGRREAKALDILDQFWRLSMVAVVLGYPIGALVVPLKMLLFSEWRSMVRWMADVQGSLGAWIDLGRIGGILAVGALWWWLQRRRQPGLRGSGEGFAMLWVLTLPTFATFAGVVGIRGGTRGGMYQGILWTAGEVLLLLLVLGWNRWRKVGNDQDGLISWWAWASLAVWSVGTAVAVAWYWLGWEGANRLLPPFILSMGWLQYSAFEPWLVRWVVYAVLRGLVFAFLLRSIPSAAARGAAVA